MIRAIGHSHKRCLPDCLPFISNSDSLRAFALLKLEVVGLARLNLKVVLLIGLLAHTF